MEKILHYINTDMNVLETLFYVFFSIQLGQGQDWDRVK